MRYLKEAPHEEAMRVFYAQPQPPPHTHSVWTGDFMAACTHDIACPVCFDAPALIERNVTPGKWQQSVQPCDKCRTDGYRVMRLPRWILRVLGHAS